MVKQTLQTRSLAMSLMYLVDLKLVVISEIRLLLKFCNGFDSLLGSRNCACEITSHGRVWGCREARYGASPGTICSPGPPAPRIVLLIAPSSAAGLSSTVRLHYGQIQVHRASRALLHHLKERSEGKEELVRDLDNDKIYLQVVFQRIPKEVRHKPIRLCVPIGSFVLVHALRWNGTEC